MSEAQVHFSQKCIEEENSFKLVELPPVLASLFEAGGDIDPSSISLAVKGHTSEDATLCTNDKTYTLRSVVLSNSILVVSPPPDDGTETSFPQDAVVIRDQVKEVLELVPAVPKVHKLETLLRGRAYEGPEEESQLDVPLSVFTIKDAREEIQASDAELTRGLEEARVLNINGELRPISRAYLAQILELILNLLVSLSLPPSAVSVETLTSALADDHEVPRTVSTQVMAWFGEIRGGKWNMEVNDIVREVGLGLLRKHKDDPIARDVLLAKWKNLVGDTFEENISLGLLAGNYLLTPGQAPTLTYFPRRSLPVDPAARFRDLFLTRPRWKVDDITPFLSDIAVDIKERDKLLLKYARSVTDTDGLWYTARTQYTA